MQIDTLLTMQLYAITGGRTASFGQQTAATNPGLLAQSAAWARGQVDFIQLREKHLSGPELELLTRAVAGTVVSTGSKLLVNIARALDAPGVVRAGAAGVHLSGPPQPGAVRMVRQSVDSEVIISAPCHNLVEVALAGEENVDLIVFSPVFEKPSDPQAGAQGLEMLHRACIAARHVPVFALGGVNLGNAEECVAAGAAGVAGIRMFAGEDWFNFASGQGRATASRA